MRLSKNLQDKYSKRFSELIEEGQLLVNSIEVIPPRHRGNPYTYTTYNWDPQQLGQWMTNCLTMLEQFATKDTKIKEQVDLFCSSDGTKHEVEYRLGILKAFQSNFEQGFLDDILLKVEAEIAGDYMGQAEKLLDEGQKSQFNHVPAAVLAGAVLEKALRSLCNNQQPPIVLATPQGGHKMMNALIDDLKKSGVFNELKAKQLRSWADIRNAAAHGRFEDFNKSDVEQMLQGVTSFLADYLQ